MKVAAVAIHRGDIGKVDFEVRGADGRALATIAPFATMCRLGVVLATLAGAATQEGTATSSPNGSVIGVGRRKVQLREPLDHAEVAAVIHAAAVARVEDHRLRTAGGKT